MNNNEYDRLYGRFTETIQDATKNLDRLDDILNGKVSEALEHAAEKVNEAFNSSSTVHEMPRKEAPVSKPVHRNVTPVSARKKALYDSGNDLMAASIVGIVLGGVSLLVFFFLVAVNLITLIMSSNPVFAAIAAGLAFSILFFAGAITGFSLGGKGLSIVKRFREYKDLLQNKTVIELSELSNLTGKSVRFLVKDLKKMMKSKLFFQGHFDKDMTSFITSDETFKHYEELMESMKKQAEIEKQEESYSGELKDVLNKGYEYLEKIQVANAALPGEVITEKLQNLENVIRRILEEVKLQPKSVSDLNQLMTYYLPTTWKLISAYQEIEHKNPKTEQMISSQREIETTLDTVNEAFKKLLDQLFQKKAWDISSDIDVLNSMLTSEGLKDGTFVLKK